MKRNFILIIMLVFLFAGCQDVVEQTNVVSENQVNKNEAEGVQIDEVQNEKVAMTANNENFLKILKTNKDGQDYLKLHPETYVVEFKKIMPENFETLKNGTEYKALYEDLPEKELYFVEFRADTSNLNLQAIVDLEEQKVVNIVGVYLVGMG